MTFYFFLALGLIGWAVAYNVATWLVSALVCVARGAEQDPTTCEITFRPWGATIFAITNVTTCSLTAGFISSAVVQYLAADTSHWAWFWYPWGFLAGMLTFAKSENEESAIKFAGVAAFMIAYPVLCFLKPHLGPLSTAASWMVP